MALVPSQHDHEAGEWIGIRIKMDQVVTFAKDIHESASLDAPSYLNE